jgi:hypothetical protein
LEQRRAVAARYARLDYAIGNWRLGVFGSGVLIGWLAFKEGLFSPWCLVVPLLVFLILVVQHERVIQTQRRAARAADFYRNGLKRLEDRWAGTGVTGTRFTDPDHLYSGDLDIFGPGSLFELLCTARTRAGEDCLAAWLCASAPPETIRARQAAIAELRSRLDLREELFLLGDEVRSAIDPDALTAWGEAPVKLVSRQVRLALAGLAGLTVLALAGWAAGYGIAPFLALGALEQVCITPLRARVRHIVRAVEKPGKDLVLFALLLKRLEQEAFDAPLLQELRAALDTDQEPPSVRIARLQRYIELLDMRRNQLFVPIDAALLWTVQFAFAIESWRARSGPDLARWLRVVGEFEALSALAGYAYEHPADPFPQITQEPEFFVAEGLGHPLLPESSSVRNDLSLDAEQRLFVVSGSNMSGKSTLLRTVGTNAVLAMAGAPVRARQLRIAPLSIGASIRTQDSLQTGISRFYAEILRLRQIVVRATEHAPLLFLLDEIMQGTNSHDRRIGAEAVLHALLARGAVGLVTTHDLALAQIANSGEKAINVHFEDQLLDGKMTFDYHLHPGVVTKSNAIELMRAVGLEV